MTMSTISEFMDVRHGASATLHRVPGWRCGRKDVQGVTAIDRFEFASIAIPHNLEFVPALRSHSFERRKSDQQARVRR